MNERPHSPNRLAKGLCALSALLAFASSAAWAAPLGDEERAIFLKSREDKAAENLDGITADAEGKHYVTGNEWNLHLFAPRIMGLGGGYVGVGSDQAYLFIGWQKPTLAWLIDYDPYVVQIHKLYQAFFLAAETPEAFRALWEPEQADKAREALASRYRTGEALLLETRLRSYRKRIKMRLDRLAETLVAAEVPSFLTDPETYTWVRDFIADGRARPMIANLLDKRGLAGIGEASRKLGVPIRLVYLSNAEEYWGYDYLFRRNMQRLHVDAQSVLLRTLLTWDRNRDYRYNVQPFMAFLAWLSRPDIFGVRQITGYRKDAGLEPDFLEIGFPPGVDPTE